MNTLEWLIENYPAEGGRKMLEAGINPGYIAELINRDFIPKEKIRKALDKETNWDFQEKLKGLLNEPACEHHTQHKRELDCYPYGDNCQYDLCVKCKEKLNFKIF